MPISHPFKCIFVHIPRTGGTAIEVALDLFGRHRAEDRKMLFGLYKKRENEDYHLSTAYLQHLSLQECKRFTSDKIYNEYFKFAFVRNPWERALSAYLYQYTVNPRTFKEFLQHADQVFHNIEQYKFIVDERNRIALNFLGRFETLEEDFKKVCGLIGHKPAVLLHVNTRRHAHYSIYYNKETKELIERRYKRDIEMFGYTFESKGRWPSTSYLSKEAGQCTPHEDITWNISPVLSVLKEEMHHARTMDFKIKNDTSMMPILKKGDEILVQGLPLQDVRKGDIVAYCMGKSICAHRCVSKYKNGSSFYLTTKGDNIKDFDSYRISEDIFIGKVISAKRNDKILNFENVFWSSAGRFFGQLSYIQATTANRKSNGEKFGSSYTVNICLTFIEKVATGIFFVYKNLFVFARKLCRC